MPAISVVVPCYNGGRFLDQLTASLARQTFRDFELIIVDDGSPDPATRATLAQLDPAIRVIRHPVNRRMSAARNTGFDAARAEFVLVLDCDDQIEPTFMEECLAVLRSSPADVGFAFTHLRLVGADHGIRKPYFNTFDVLFKNVVGYNMLVRKSAWLKAGKYDESMTDGYEDWEFNIRLIRAGYRGIEVPKPLFLYSVSMDGMMMSHSSQRHAALWRRIRVKHKDLYRVPNLLRLWRQNRGARSDMSPLFAVAALLLTGVLPDKWFSAIIHAIRSRRFSPPKHAGAAIARPSAVSRS